MCDRQELNFKCFHPVHLHSCRKRCSDSHVFLLLLLQTASLLPEEEEEEEEGGLKLRPHTSLMLSQHKAAAQKLE